MTIKEAFKKIDVYNEVANAIGSNSLRIYITIGKFDGEYFETFKDFKNYLKENYIDEAVDTILNYTQYEFNELTELVFTDSLGYGIIEYVEISAYCR
jgi:hypothetical protein